MRDGDRLAVSPFLPTQERREAGPPLQARFARVFACIGVLAVAGCDATLASGLAEGEANAVIVALDGQGIGATKESEGTGDDVRFAVHVAADDVARALSVLDAAELPRTAEPGLAETFGAGGLVPTATEERARLSAAIAGELARSIESIDGVLDARVHVALPEARPLRLDAAEAPRPRASVLVKHRADAEPPDLAQIRALVAGAVDGMRPEDVAIVTAAAAALPAAGESALVHVGPIAVSRGTAPAFKAIGASVIALDLVLAAALVLVIVRRRRADGAPPAGGSPPAPAP